ncbi:hypothetical protein IJ765_01120 [Candidatus Saccharibacteria bacterium]|nr:hypothetical protein [Candidatus Saccharibacteria bacterium]
MQIVANINISRRGYFTVTAPDANINSDVIFDGKRNPERRLLSHGSIRSS